MASANYWWEAEVGKLGQASFGNQNKNDNEATIDTWEREMSYFADASYLFETDSMVSVAVNGGIRIYD